jgi:hypothetical protein
MKNKIKQISAATTAFAAFCVLFLAPSLCQAQIAGGYQEISKIDETAVATANFAVRTRAKKDVSLKLISIERAERQVVAGANYRLCLAVKSNNKRREATAVVYQNLQNKFSLTSWTDGKCASAAANQAGDKDNNNDDNETVTSPARQTGPTAVKPAAASTAANAPDVIVKNLYAAQKNPQTSPFFQTKKRALVDKYFTKELADLLWKDVVGADGVGNLDFDPLYNAQDTRITAFKIDKPDYGEGNRQVADVAVTFKNMGKAETILFRLEQNAAQIWKIGDIYYPQNEESNNSLKTILSR